MPDLVIKNARIFINDAIQPMEIAVDNGKITKLGKIVGTEEVNQVINAKGALVLPGAIDVHVHFRDPGMKKKEDWYTGSCSAAAGGVTTVIDHPNTIPPTINPESFKKKQKAAKKSIIDYGINAGVTNNLEYLKELWELGATSFGEIFLAESTASLNVNY
ncbi:MAG: amidohydrolase family protein, partial [Candidatus Methanoperedens sp.]